MDWQAWIWEIANSPVIITAIASLVVYGLNKLYAKKPLWKKFEGSLISAVKLAEKNIPDDTPNKSLHRLDEALKYMCQVFQQVEGRVPTEAEKLELTEGIHTVHDTLEARETL